jgi:hypothetical protein
MRTILLFLFIMLLTITAKSQSGISFQYMQYDEGSYYDTSGKKISGLIKIDVVKNQLLFMTDSYSLEKQIDINQISSVKSPKYDTLTVMTDASSGKKYFGKLVGVTPNIKFYYKAKRTWYTPIIVSTTKTRQITKEMYDKALNNPDKDTYHVLEKQFMYEQNGATYPLTKNNYAVILAKAYKDIPNIADRLNGKTIKYSDLETILK